MAVDVRARGGSRARRVAGANVQAARVALSFAVAALVLAAVVGGAWRLLPRVHAAHAFGETGIPWLDGWMHWDAGWYAAIARHGYAYTGHGQSSVAFFPLYPLAIRVGAFVTRDALVAGVLVTGACGFAATVLFSRWLDGRVTPQERALAVALLLLYPYAFYLYGAVYSDALFLACALGAFVLLEDGRPWWSGALGALATAARPIGPFLVVALVVRAVEIEHARGRDARMVRAVTATASSALGIGVYAAYLAVRFGDPLAFARTQSAWGHGWTFATLVKLPLLHDLEHATYPYGFVRYAVAPALTLLALSAVPAVFRRFGRAYGLYALLVVAFPALVTDDLFSMGRFLLAAFPCFAIAGAVLASRGRVARGAVLGASAAGLVVVSSMLARGYFLA